MGFLKKLFGGDDASGAGREGFFLYVQCDNCKERVRLRIVRQHDLNRTDSGYVWHKTIVDNRCFRQIPTVVQFDGNLNIISSEIDGGHFIDQAEYEQAEVSQTTDTDSTDV